MPISTFTYNLDGAMTTAQGEPFSTIHRHKYTRLPVKITGIHGDISLRYDSYGRRLHKNGAQTIFYRSGVRHTLVELVDGDEIAYLFTPTGQSITRRENSYVRIARDHLRSVRVETSLTENIATIVAAHYSAYGEPMITGGQLRRAFAGYEPDAEVGLYNAHRRLYAPTLRLFVSVDPRLQDASPYPYCAADPFNRIDPTGGISSATISSIVSAILIVVTIVADIFTGGALSELFAPEAAAETGAGSAGGTAAAVEGGELGGEAGSEAGSEAGGEAAQKAAQKAAEMAAWRAQAKGQAKVAIAGIRGATTGAKMGATIGAASSIVSNGAGLAAKAAHGEHITAWQAIRSMLIEPAIAAMAGTAGGEVAGYGLAGSAGGMEMIEGVNPRLLAIGTAVVGGASAGGIASVANTVLDGTITTRRGWEQIGIQMAIAAGEALILAGVFMRPRAVDAGAELSAGATKPEAKLIWGEESEGGGPATELSQPLPTTEGGALQGGSPPVSQGSTPPGSMPDAPPLFGSPPATQGSAPPPAMTERRVEIASLTARAEALATHIETVLGRTPTVAGPPA